MDTATRMMIAGMALQGLLANPNLYNLQLEWVAPVFEHDVDDEGNTTARLARRGGEDHARPVGRGRMVKDGYHKIGPAQAKLREQIVKEAFALTGVLEGNVPDEQGEPELVKLVRICSVSWEVFRVASKTSVDKTWAELSDEIKEPWFAAVQAAVAGEMIELSDMLGVLGEQIIRAVVAGWLNADG